MATSGGSAPAFPAGEAEGSVISNYFHDLMNELQRSLGDIDRQEFLIISAVAIGLGAYFLRGFGSRTGY